MCPFVSAARNEKLPQSADLNCIHKSGIGTRRTGNSIDTDSELGGGWGGGVGFILYGLVLPCRGISKSLHAMKPLEF